MGWKANMVTEAEIITEINKLKEELGIQSGNATFFYGQPQVSDCINGGGKRRIEEATGCNLYTSFVGSSRFGRFLCLESGKGGFLDCKNEAFLEKIR